MRFNRLAGHQVQPVALHDHGDDQGRLHEREVVANAQARAASEREVGEPRTSVAALGGEVLRVEALQRFVLVSLFYCLTCYLLAGGLLEGFYEETPSESSGSMASLGRGLAK